MITRPAACSPRMFDHGQGRSKECGGAFWRGRWRGRCDAAVSWPPRARHFRVGPKHWQRYGLKSWASSIAEAEACIRSDAQKTLVSSRAQWKPAYKRAGRFELAKRTPLNLTRNWA